MADEMRQRTLVVLKPDAMERELYPELLARYRDKGLQLVHMETMCLAPNRVERLYATHRGKTFFPHLVKAMTDGPVLCIVFEGNHAVDVVRRLHGLTDPTDAYAGTIRGDYGVSKAQNVVHGSDSAESALREIRIIFGRKCSAKPE